MADETRAGFLLALLDGRAWTAGELARRAGVAASTASEHLGKLVTGGLLTEERQGRHRYVRLADARVAQLVEDLVARTGPATAELPRTLRESSAGSAMARGRTCYDHLAGRLGIALTDALTVRGLLRQDTGFALTDAGLRWFAASAIDLDRTARRPLGPVVTFPPARRRHARPPSALRAWEGPPLAAPGTDPRTTSTRACARHAESPHLTPPGPPFGRTTGM